MLFGSVHWVCSCRSFESLVLFFGFVFDVCIFSWNQSRPLSTWTRFDSTSGFSQIAAVLELLHSTQSDWVSCELGTNPTRTNPWI